MFSYEVIRSLNNRYCEEQKALSLTELVRYLEVTSYLARRRKEIEEEKQKKC